MKLRKKNTGEIGIINLTVITDDSNYCYETLENLLNEWYVANPTEPLIKDEKVRKAVRAWYELFDESQLGQFEDGKYIAVGYREFVLQTLDTSLTYTFELPFIDGMQILKERWGLGADYYTIIELCGEEEE